MTFDWDWWRPFIIREYEIGDVKVKEIDGEKRYNSVRRKNSDGYFGLGMMLGVFGDEQHQLPPQVGKQFLYSKGDTKIISLVETPNFDYRDDRWETFCLEDKLFEDIEIFDSKEEAEKRILELLQ